MNETNRLFLHWRGGKHLLNMIKLDGNLPIMLCNLPGQVFIGCKNLSKLNEGADDGNIDINGQLSAKDRGQHRYALFSESVGRVAQALLPPT